MVIGATSEDAGFDLSTDSETLDALHRAAARAVPELAGAPRSAAWAGIRPGSPDGIPEIGFDPRCRGLVHAHGHFRNGVLLAPVTAQRVHSLITGRRDG